MSKWRHAGIFRQPPALSITPAQRGQAGRLCQLHQSRKCRPQRGSSHMFENRGTQRASLMSLKHVCKAIPAKLPEKHWVHERIASEPQANWAPRYWVSGEADHRPEPILPRQECGNSSGWRIMSVSKFWPYGFSKNFLCVDNTSCVSKTGALATRSSFGPEESPRAMCLLREEFHLTRNPRGPSM